MTIASNKPHFFDTLYNLRTCEEILLFTRIMTITPDEEQLVKDWLETEYQQECLNYPYTAPTFDGDAAIWAAKTLYFSSQLLLYRENKDAELQQLLPSCPVERTAAAILSADLCLRFLPTIIRYAHSIDAEDELATLLEQQLQSWHYSGIGYPLNYSSLDFGPMFSDQCLKQLYINRIIQYKSKPLAEQPFLKSEVRGSMGALSNVFWNDL